jgi:phosphate transport system substrate-binding protein
MVANGTKIKLNRFAWVGAIAALSATVSLSIPVALAQSNEIRIDGSSTVFPITEAVAEEFIAATGGATPVTVGISGTGGGFSKFCNGETDISNASRPIKESEIEACEAAGIEFIELPVAFDALTVVINPNNTWAESMTVEELRMLWEPDAANTITRWSQVRSGWPDEPIALYGPGTDSGTFDYFTEAIMGESGASRADYTASEDDNILVQGVQGDENALGYFGYSYYAANEGRLQAVAVDNGDGPVAPSDETVENGTYQPLARPIFIYVNAEAAERPEMQEFIEFYINNAPTLVAEVDYVPLPAEAYAAALENFQSGKTGSVFAGRDTIGVSIAELLRLETE